MEGDSAHIMRSHYLHSRGILAATSTKILTKFPILRGFQGQFGCISHARRVK